MHIESEAELVQRDKQNIFAVWWKANHSREVRAWVPICTKLASLFVANPVFSIKFIAFDLRGVH